MNIRNILSPIRLDNLDWVYKDENWAEVTATITESPMEIKLVFAKPPASEYDHDSVGMCYHCKLYIKGDFIREFEDWGTRRSYIRWIRMIMRASENYFGHPFTIPVTGSSRSL